MNWDAPDPSLALKLFKQKCELYFSVKEIKKEKQVDHILLFAGETALKFYNSWGLSAEDAKQPEKVWAKLQTQVEPKVNYRVARLFLQKLKQEECESFDDYVAKCKLQAFKCNFRDEQEVSERVIEQIITGTRHTEVQKELLGKDQALTLDQALEIGRTHEASLQHMQQLKQSQQQHEAQNVHYMKRAPPHKGEKACTRCGYKAHIRREDCPALGSTCSVCGKPNHWSPVCRLNQSGPAPSRQQKPRRQSGHQAGRQGTGHPRREHRAVNAITEDDVFSHLTINSLEISAISSIKEDSRDEAFTYLATRLDDQKVMVNLRVKVDTGAQGNTLPVRMYQQMFPNSLTAEGLPQADAVSHTDTVLTAYNGTIIKQHGCVELPCRFGDSDWTPTKFFVVESEGPAIVGLPSSRQLNLVTLHCAITATESKEKVKAVEDLVRLYPDQFDKIGKFPGKYHIQLKEDAQPVIHAQRKFSIHLRDQLKAQLEEMERTEVIKKVQEPTDWVNSMVCTKKSDGTLRVCLDPKDLNKAIKRCHHKTPTLEELTHKLAGATVFSKLDAKNGYWSVELDDSSSLLTTFNTPFGRYRYLRMPFGLVMSQDVFQRKMDQILEECPGTMGIADDVAVFGKNEADHDANLHNLFAIAKKHGLTFNSKKCSIKQQAIRFYGVTYDRDGAHPDQDKVADIKGMAKPSNQKELQEFLGIITYMSPFMPKLSDATEPLRRLLKKDTEFSWTPSHDSAFQQVQNLICTETTLAYFDPQKTTTVQVDASQKGLGAALMQDGRPIAFASKSLSEVEQRYANIERELLAVVFGCERFHTYLFGRPFTVESDHKPLEMIQLKNLGAAPPRLQRMLMRLQYYDLQIVYRPGKEMLLADGLSRLPPKNNSHLELDVQVNLIHFGASKIQELKDKTAQDRTLTDLRDVIVTGWPGSRKGLPTSLRPFWSCRDELSVEDSLVLKGERVVIPEAMRDEILERIHEGHQGHTKCKLRARECVFWPDINKDIEELTARCHICLEHARSQPKQPMLETELPTRPWQIIATDLFQLKGTTYLAVADYYSKFPIVKKMPENCTSNAVINALKEILSEYGIPDTIRSDNGPQYDSEQFAAFTKKWGIEHITSSPHFPQSNGFIERTIQTLKMTLRKAMESGGDAHMALLNLRTTPIDSHLPSPAELLQGRRVRGNLPMRSRPSRDQDDTHRRLTERQGNQKAYYDRNTVELTPLSPGQPIRVQHPQTGRWRPATVLDTRPEPRSYNIRTDDGAVYRRNRRQLRGLSPSPPRAEQPPASPAPQPVPDGEDATPPMPAPAPRDPGSRTTRSGRAIVKPDRLDL